jgi:Uma2 family endonuclease
VTISDDRLKSPKYLAFLEKLTNHHRWTADDYDSIPDDIVVEIYDGSIHVVPSPSPDHQIVSTDLTVAFRAAVHDRHRVVPDVDVNVLGKIYKPDVLVLREATNLQPIPGSLIQIVVEIISENENIERTAKKAAYAAQGIPLYLVVAGKRGERYVEVYRLWDSEYRLDSRVAPGVRMEFGEPFPFVIDMKQINS